MHNFTSPTTKRRRTQLTLVSLLGIIMTILVRDATALRSINPGRVVRSVQQRLQQSPPTPEKHLVLVGGGHAHAQVIKALNKASRPSNLRVTLIDKQASASYSGMVPGCIAGRYHPDDTLLHLRPLAEWADIEYVHDRVMDIDLECKIVHLAGENNYDENSSSSSTSIPFDCISVDIGSTSRGLDDCIGARQYTIPTRPIYRLIDRIEDSEQNMTTAPHVVVIGGGAAGVELSLSIKGRWEPKFEDTRVTLLDAGDELLPSESERGRSALKQVMANRGVTVQHQTNVKEITQSHIHILAQDGTEEAIPYSHCIWATGAGAHPLALKLKDKGLDATKHGWIRVNDKLQSTSHPFVFAAGDCCSIEGLANGPPAKAGVYAVRAGPVLIENLTRFINGCDKPLQAYVPQSDFLKLLVCGDGTALGFRFGQALHGKWVMELKDKIDQNFMNLFKRENLPEHKSGEPYDTSQYDAKLAAKTDLQPEAAATLLSRTDDGVDFEEAWSVLRTMADDESYRDQVLEMMEEPVLMA